MIEARLIVTSEDAHTEIRKTDTDPAVAVARCLMAMSEYEQSPKLRHIAELAWKVATDA